MRTVAASIGIRAASLYKHVSSRDEIVAMIQARTLAGSAEAMTGVRRDPLSVATAYRTYALAHPHQYVLTNNQPLLREYLPDGLEDAAAQPVLDVAGGDRTRARILWATAHGLVSLELAHRFPPGTRIEPLWRAAFTHL